MEVPIKLDHCVVHVSDMANEQPTKRPEELEGRRVEQLTRILAWTEPERKPEQGSPREDSHDTP